MKTSKSAGLIIMGILAAICDAAIQPYSLPDPAGQTYAVTVNGQTVPVKEYKDFEYIHFGMSSQAQIEITATGISTINDYRIRPERRKIPGAVSANKLSFSIDDPQYLVINVNFLKKLFIYADPIETDMPSLGATGVVNIMSYGVDSTGGSVITSKLQKAIDELPINGTLYIPAGMYRTGSFSLKSNMTLYLAAGALLKGSDNHLDIVKAGSFLYFMRGSDLNNVAVRGRGALDGNGKAVRSVYDAEAGKKVPGRLVSITGGNTVTIEGLQLRDSYSWNCHPVNITNLHINRVKVLNDFTQGNGDGFDIDRCVDALIENSFVYAEDDAITPKASWGSGNPARNTYRNCVLWSHQATGIRVGAETNCESFSDFLFENIDILNSNSMIRIYNWGGANIHNFTFKNIWVEDYGMYHDDRYDEVSPGEVKSGETFLVYFYDTTTAGRYNTITFENLVSMGTHVRSRLDAVNATHVQMDSISFINFTVGNSVIVNATDAKLEKRNGVGTVTFSSDDSVAVSNETIPTMQSLFRTAETTSKLVLLKGVQKSGLNSEYGNFSLDGRPMGKASGFYLHHPLRPVQTK